MVTGVGEEYYYSSNELPPPDDLIAGLQVNGSITYDDDPGGFYYIAYDGSWNTNALFNGSLNINIGDLYTYTDQTIDITVHPNYVQIRTWLYPAGGDFTTLPESNNPSPQNNQLVFNMGGGFIPSVPLDLNDILTGVGTFYFTESSEYTETYSCNSPEGECYIYHEGGYNFQATVSSVPIPGPFILFASALTLIAGFTRSRTASS
jgi:hypothetical protein